MPLLRKVVAGRRFGDPQCVVDVREGLARVDELIASEVAHGDEAARDAALVGCETGGTRPRPLFTLLAAQFGPAPDAWQVTVSGAATELLYLATLCHDNVVADSEVRGGAARTHTRNANNSAILAGDYQFATASRLASRLGQYGFRVVAETFAEVVTGKMRETLGAAPGADPIEHYLRCAHEKSGSLLAAAGQLGATFSGANEQLRVALSLLGRLVGTAAAISHDLVDIPSAVRRGVHTLPVLYALSEQGPVADRLRATLAAPIDDDNVAEAVALVRSLPGMKQANKVLDRYVAQAGEQLVSLPDTAGRQALTTLIDDLSTVQG